MSSHPTRLDHDLERFVDAAITGDTTTARLAFADAQAHDLQAAGLDAHVWVATELQSPPEHEQ